MKRKVEALEKQSEAQDNSDALLCTEVVFDEQQACPSYGLKNYWDERYGKNAISEVETEKSTDLKKLQLGEKGSAGFSWYFTYTELRPLLLPLLLGRDEEDEEWSDCEEFEEILEASNEDFENSEEDGDNSNENSDNDNNDDVDEAAEVDDEMKADEKIDDVGNASEDKSESQIILKDKKDTDIDSEDDEIPSEEVFVEKLKNLQPCSRKFLEIGCGDVPLGSELCIDLISLQKSSNVDAKKRIQEIICFDYSNKCIEQLLCQQKEKKDGKANLRVDYKVHDARDLPYKDKEFNVIVDKGTLDAMLSDEVEGSRNCVKIVSEAARILRVDGYLLIVSHLNANCPEGLSWVNEVLVKGLKDGDCDSKWTIEVHSNDAEKEDSAPNVIVVAGSEENAENDSKSAKLGPAVYIIRKMGSCNDDQRKNTSSEVDLKFFGY